MSSQTISQIIDFTSNLIGQTGSSLSHYDEDMTDSTVSTSSTSDEFNHIIKSRKTFKDQSNQIPVLPTIASVDDENAGVHLSHHSAHNCEGYEVEYFHDSLMQLDLSCSAGTGAGAGTDAANSLLQVQDVPPKKQGNSIFCCFCPPDVGTSFDTDEENERNSSIFDFSLDFNLKGHDLDTDTGTPSNPTLIQLPLTLTRNAVEEQDDENISFSSEDEASIVSIGQQSIRLNATSYDEYISCCDTGDFSQDEVFMNVQSALQIEKESRNNSTSPHHKQQQHQHQQWYHKQKEHQLSSPFVPYSRLIRVCDLNVDDGGSKTMDLAEHNGGDTSMNKKDDKEEDVTVTTLTGCKNGSIETSLSSSSITDDSNSIATKLNFLELTNKYDQGPKGHNNQATVIQAMNSMTKIGLNIATTNINQDINDPLISWTKEGSTSKILKQTGIGSDNNSEWYTCSSTMKLLETEVLSWSGSMISSKKGKSQAQQQQSNSSPASLYGSKIPLFKARGIIPSISPLELTELILDSSRVKLYNKWTNGRTDALVLQNDVGAVDELYGNGCLKVVESETNIPMSNKILKMANFLHARPIVLYDDDLHGTCSGDNEDQSNSNKIHCTADDNPNAYILVSRSTYTCDDVSEAKSSNTSQASLGSKNEILWSVNILRAVPGHPDKTDLLTITQANSSVIPNFLARKVGMMGACDFFTKLRGMKV